MCSAYWVTSFPSSSRWWFRKVWARETLLRRNVMYLLRFWKTTEHNRVSGSTMWCLSLLLLLLHPGLSGFGLLPGRLVSAFGIVSGRNVGRYVILQRCWNNKDPFSAEQATLKWTIWGILGIIDKSANAEVGDSGQERRRRWSTVQETRSIEIVSGFGTYFNIIIGCGLRLDDVMVGMSSMNAFDYILVTKSG